MDDIDALLPPSIRIPHGGINIEDVLLYLDVLEQGPVPLILELEALLRKMKEEEAASTTET